MTFWATSVRIQPVLFLLYTFIFLSDLLGKHLKIGVLVVLVSLFPGSKAMLMVEFVHPLVVQMQQEAVLDCPECIRSTSSIMDAWRIQWSPHVDFSNMFFVILLYIYIQYVYVYIMYS